MTGPGTAFAEIWSYLGEGPLVWLTLTLLAWLVGDALNRASGRSALVNPVVVAVMLLGALLWVTGTPYATYFEGAQFVHFLLGPATVALALPLYAHRGAVARTALPMLAALVAGSLTAMGVAVGIGAAFGLGPDLLLALLVKSVTAPVAIGIAEGVGGSPTLTAVVVILTGITGAVIVTPLFNLLRFSDWRARGFALGLTAHGIGTARAFQVHETAGAFAGIGMGLNAVLTAVLAPVLATWLL